MLSPKPDWLTRMFPWEQQSLVVNGRTMAYIDEGDPNGRPVLLLSGNPTWGFLYRDFIEPLTRAGYRAIAPDWVGAGYSDHPRIDAALTLAHHVADLTSLMDQLQLRGFVIVGQDWGGPQGAGAALQRIERLGAMVLMSTWFFNGFVGRFHQSPRPWTTWQAPLIGQFFMKRLKVLSQNGPTAISKTGHDRRRRPGLPPRVRRAGVGRRSADVAAHDPIARRRPRLGGHGGDRSDGRPSWQTYRRCCFGDARTASSASPTRSASKSCCPRQRGRSRSKTPTTSCRMTRDWRSLG